MRYRVTVEGVSRELRLGPSGLEVEGAPLPAEIAGLPGTGLRHLRIGDRGVVFFGRRGRDGWEIGIGGRWYRVRVEDERALALRTLSGSTAVPRPGVLRAPMPGLVLRVEVEPGQRVEEGTPLLVMEAMKMENELLAAGPGRVSAVEVRAGDAVERDAVLVRFEP